MTDSKSAPRRRSRWKVTPFARIGIAVGVVALIVVAGVAASSLASAKLQNTAAVSHSASAVAAVKSSALPSASTAPTPTPTPTPTTTSAVPSSAASAAAETAASAGGAAVSSAGAVLPNAVRTPGAINAAVTQATIAQTICTSGWTSTIRPPSSFTTALKVKQLASGYSYQGDTRTADYEEDHLISLELGGSPTAEANLWPEPYVGTSGARVKDQIENKLNALVCSGAITLATAQSAITSNWWGAYQIYVLHTPATAPAPPAVAEPAPAPQPPATPAQPPASASDHPVGATGQCVDGTYTSAAHRTGACSRHGGLSVYY
ncbi:MAG: DUF3761 domain-containing protein [Microbacteriaceae bacterium]|nr:DUF3761 domain-containing protein [Microbacteriaceae bacterium]